jgi:quercetin dioxygenase-like cupin family protein
MVTSVTDPLTASLAATLAAARRARGLSAVALAERSGVSRAMIGKIERTDPATGYVRRAVSPPGGGPTELVEVVLPPGAEVGYPAESYSFVSHLIWVLEGRLRFREGDVLHDLVAGDCLQLGPPQPCAYVNATTAPCRYVVVLTRRPG